MGIVLDRSVWKLRKTSPLPDSERWQIIEYIDQSESWKSYAPSKPDWNDSALVQDYDPDFCEGFSVSANRLCVYVQSRESPKAQFVETIECGELIDAFAISTEKDSLIVALQSRIEIYGRTQKYGWSGTFSRPLGWLAAILFAILIATFGRNALRAACNYKIHRKRLNQPVFSK